MSRILYDKDGLIAAVKPAGLLSEDSGKEDSFPFLLRSEREKEGKSGYIGCVHRLDRETGGVILYAADKAAAASLSSLIAERKVEKEYLAILCGVPEAPEGELNDLLFKDMKKNKSYVVKRMRKGVREASLRYTLLADSVLDGKRVSLIRVRLITGRSHQIRVQFSSRGLPLLGDRRYGGFESPGNGLALWSYKIAVRYGDEPLVFCCPPEGEPWRLFKDMLL